MALDGRFMRVRLINHACCKVETDGGLGLLFDPWTEGSAFNAGWDLLIPTPVAFDEIMEGVSLIWISHEHPDHFSPAFLARVAKAHGNNVTILFQATRDRRVVQFCKSLGLAVQELANGVPTRLSPTVTATCGAYYFYDSWLYLTDGRHSLLNLNDCPARTERDIRKIARLAPEPTLLLSQFSYAAWKGGRDNRAFRAAAAAQKLETVATQTRMLRPRFTLPFASLIYFSNVENSYLNDAVNTPRKAADAIVAAGSTPVVLYPGDAWQFGDPSTGTEDALDRYDRRYAEMAALPLRPPGASVGLEELRTAFESYRSRVFARNSRWLIRFLSKLRPLGVFQPVIVKLRDLDRSVAVSVVSGFAEQPTGGAEPDVTLHSSSLLFMFKNEFGFDTLTVNGRFEASADGFARMMRSFSVGSLNALGLSVSWRLLFSLRLVLILVRHLIGVLARLRRPGERQPSPLGAASD
jgi:UDP-MurNAc hydroxylase